MSLFIGIAPLCIGLLIINYLVHTIYERTTYKKAMRRHGCLVPKTMGKGNAVAYVGSYFSKYGKTFQTISRRKPEIYTMDHRVIQTALSLEFDKFGIEANRKLVFEPLMSDGLLVSDGMQWVHARVSVKPVFSGIRNSGIETFKKHVNQLLTFMPQDGWTVDLQPLLNDMYQDKSIEYIFGQSLNALLKRDPDEEVNRFVAAFDHRFLRGYDPEWKKDVALVHEFVDKLVDNALKQHNRGSPTNEDGNYVFQIELDKLHAEVLELGSTSLTFESLKSLKYLRFVINESMRLLAPAGLSQCTALEDCVLPYGGGPSGASTILVREGTEIRIVFHALRKNPDIWGFDTLKFRPEPCPAQQMALTEIAYVLVRFLQEFNRIESAESIRLSLESGNGVNMAFVNA
ncbi:cytochrome P450 [Bisporella sp. PMI_857]|nr:cytochrome P450 [Bisporella sp. PMI_857]